MGHSQRRACEYPATQADRERPATPSRDPETTTLSGPLIAAIDTSWRGPPATFATSASPAKTAAMAPLRGKRLHQAPALGDELEPVLKQNTPATHAATYSPTLCPSTAAGCNAPRLPQLGQSILQRKQRRLGVAVSSSAEAARRLPDRTSKGAACRDADATSPRIGPAPRERPDGLVELPAHADVLGALAREEKRDLGRVVAFCLSPQDVRSFTPGKKCRKFLARLVDDAPRSPTDEQSGPGRRWP